MCVFFGGGGGGGGRAWDDALCPCGPQPTDHCCVGTPCLPLPLPADGSAAVAVEVVRSDGELHLRAKRNAAGGFFQIYQHNKWVARKKKEAEAGQAAQREAAAAAQGPVAAR